MQKLKYSSGIWKKIWDKRGSNGIILPKVIRINWEKNYIRNGTYDDSGSLLPI